VSHIPRLARCAVAVCFIFRTVGALKDGESG